MKAVARAKRAEPDKYGETKQRYMFMLTETASNAVDVAAENLGITRSELLERIIRREFVKPNRTDEAAAS
jgi:predicted ArsR family transcriptional regulator